MSVAARLSQPSGARRPTARVALAAAAALALGCLGAAPTMDTSAAASRSPAARSCGPGQAWLVPFQTSPFPYRGTIPGKGVEFLDQRDGDRLGHTSPRGGVYWEDTTYSDRRVLLSVPPDYDPARPSVIVVYLHGNSATLERDVCRGQRIPHQVAASGLNAVLVAPQFARDALDSSAGRFWTRNGFAQFLNEAAAHFEQLTGQGGLRAAPVVLVAYSGGYYPASFAMEVGGTGTRIRGLVLMDALFGEEERFAAMIAARRSSLFALSAYSAASRSQNAEMRRLLAARGIAYGEGVPRVLRPGAIAFASSSAEHGEFMTQAFEGDPLAKVLSRVDLSR